MLTLSAISMDSRSDLPKVHYATALDWFIICSFLYCVATILEFAGVHYFTKVGSGERFGSESGTGVDEKENEISDDDLDDTNNDDNDGDDEWEDVEDWRQTNYHHRYATAPRDNHIDGYDRNERQRYVSGDIINNLGPITDPLNHNCISVYNKRYIHHSIYFKCHKVD